ncbi:unnamed protein product, partial [Rotaria sp. Silwood2]
ILVDAILALNQPDQPNDLNMVEIMEIQHRTEGDSCLVRGIVHDYGVRHPSMSKALKNAYILTCNISMEYEKTSIDNLTKECLGFVEDVYEHVLGEGKYTFVQGWKDSRSATKVQQYIY